MKILALDQSSHTSGYAIFEDKKLISWGHFSFTNKEVGKRLVRFREKLISLVEENNIDQVYFENIQLQEDKETKATTFRNVETFKVLAETYGVVEETLTELNIPHEPVYSTVWRSGFKIFGHHRQEQKANAQKWVLDNHGQNVTDDEADAICLGTYKCNPNIAEPEMFDWS